jgi:hypothetical protein
MPEARGEWPRVWSPEFIAQGLTFVEDTQLHEDGHCSAPFSHFCHTHEHSHPHALKQEHERAQAGPWAAAAGGDRDEPGSRPTIDRLL